MRLRHPDGTVVHLGYGTNVLPAEEVDGLVAQVAGLGDRLRRRLDRDRVGLGVWLPADAAHRLAGDLAAVDRLRDALGAHGVEVVTLNAFPYSGFQNGVVKKRVYRPDWSERPRLDHTVAAARVLATLLPEDAAHGSISTLPLGWRTPWPPPRAAAAADHLAELASRLDDLEAETGRSIRVGLEPEPGCVVETVADVVKHLSGLGHARLGVCLDLGHLAVGFEDAADALTGLDAAGLPLVKAQPAAGLHVEDPTDPATLETLRSYAEDRFLHQVREHSPEHPTGRDDLPQALNGDDPLPGDGPWRVHFHAPVHAAPRPPLDTTRDELCRSLATLLGGPRAQVDHLEVETYTWSTLPSGAPADDEALADGLAAELAWVRDALVSLGLEEIV